MASSSAGIRPKNSHQRRHYAAGSSAGQPDASQGVADAAPLSPAAKASLENASKLMEKASVKFEAEDYAGALTLYHDVLKLREGALGAAHPDVGEAYHLVGETLWTLGKYKEAEAALNRSLAIMRNHLGPKHKAVGSILKNIAECRQAYLNDDETKIAPAKRAKVLEQTLPLMVEATEIAQAHATGAEDDDYLDAVYALGEVYIQLERYAEALPCFEKTLPSFLKNAASDSMDTLLCWRNMSACYRALGDVKKWEEAEAKVAEIENHWKNETGSEMHDLASMRETMMAMGLEKELSQFDDTYQELLTDEDKAKLKRKPTDKQPAKPS